MGCSSQTSLGPTIEILLWNVFKCKRVGWHKDFKSMSKNKNIVMLQEAITNSPFDPEFKKSTRHEWIMARSFKDLLTEHETGVKTGSTVASDKHYFSASTHSEPISKTKKMVLATRYPLHQSEQSLLVVNSHIINFVNFEKFKANVDQVFEILRYHNGPTLLAGDFNTWNLKRLNYFNARAMDLGLIKADLFRKPRLQHLLKHLDHVYYKGLVLVDSVVHSNVHSSDHFPISLTMATTPDGQ